MSAEAGAMKVLCDATMRAAVQMLQSKGVDLLTVDAGKLSEDLNRTMIAEMQTVLDEWKEALAAHMSHEWLAAILNGQANWLALKALKAGEWIA